MIANVKIIPEIVLLLSSTAAKTTATYAEDTNDKSTQNNGNDMQMIIRPKVVLLNNIPKHK